MFVYILFGQGLGDFEMAFEVVSVHSTLAKAKAAQEEFEFQFPTYIEKYEVK